jgi:hypothetical protein
MYQKWEVLHSGPVSSIYLLPNDTPIVLTMSGSRTYPTIHLLYEQCLDPEPTVPNDTPIVLTMSGCRGERGRATVAVLLQEIQRREQELELASQLQRLQLLPDTQAMEWRQRPATAAAQPLDSDDSDQVSKILVSQRADCGFPLAWPGPPFCAGGGANGWINREEAEWHHWRDDRDGFSWILSSPAALVDIGPSARVAGEKTLWKGRKCKKSRN